MDDKYLEVTEDYREVVEEYCEVPPTDTPKTEAELPVTEEDPKRIPRTFGPSDTGLVLDGGGGKGAYQIGVLRALAEEGLLSSVKAVAGTSIGAVNAVLFAQGDFDRAYKVWDDIDMDVLFDLDPAMLAAGKICFSRDEMNRLMDTYIDYRGIAESELEIYCGVAEELGPENYRPEYMRLNGAGVQEIRNILMASTAMPIVYDTVLINGKHYRDGGVVDNEPIRPLYEAGIRKFIVIGLTAGRIFSYPQYADAEFIVIDPSHDLGDIFTGTLNFGKKDKAVKRMFGFKDGKRAIKTKIEKDPYYISLEPALAKKDYEETVKQVDHEEKVAQLEQSISSKFDYISDIEKKWGI